MWPCNIVSSKLLKRLDSTYNVGDAAVLFKFGSSKLSHVLACAFLGDIGRAANNFSPQSQRALSLNELGNSERSCPRYSL
jgi:hypothetical protein